MKNVVIAGGSGSLGQAVASHFASHGHTVFVLTRRLRSNSKFEQLLWDGKTVDASWATKLEGCILVNLAGELVDRVPTQANIDLLERSRVDPTRTLAMAANQFGKPALWLQMSTLAIYGDAGDGVLDETSQPASGPRQMAGVAKAWEACVDSSLAGRLVILRTAVVLQSGSPALNRLVTMTKLLLGGTVGSGKQWVSWIHATDFLRALDLIVANEDIAGITHMTSPEPVTNSELMRTLRKVLHRPWTPPTPAWLVKIGARLLFKTDPQLGLTGRRAMPKRLLEKGFGFNYPSLEGALKELVTSEKP